MCTHLQVATVVVEPGFTAKLTEFGDLELIATSSSNTTTGAAAATAADAPLPPAPSSTTSTCDSNPAKAPSSTTSPLNPAMALSATYDDVPVNPIQLSVFGHRFMSIAEQMGRVLQRTSVSVSRETG